MRVLQFLGSLCGDDGARLIDPDTIATVDGDDAVVLQCAVDDVIAIRYDELTRGLCTWYDVLWLR